MHDQPLRGARGLIGELFMNVLGVRQSDRLSCLPAYCSGCIGGNIDGGF